MNLEFEVQIQNDRVAHQIDAHESINFNIEPAGDPEIAFCGLFKYGESSDRTMLQEFLTPCIHHGSRNEP